MAETALRLRQELAHDDVDCLVTDGSVADFHRGDMAEFIESRPPARQLPVVLFHPQDGALPGWEPGPNGSALCLAPSLERLVDATTFFLHRGIAVMTQAERAAVDAVGDTVRTLAGKKVLIVDDDIRNIFALAAVLDEQGMEIVSAENGRDAIRQVEEDPDIDVVLMDIMMPEMDGMETMRALRKLPRGKHLPLIAVTAKAMKGDREKCIEAGAWDYLSKPVETAHLLVVLRGWLCH
jgi:CheY-like chemotaxis protein